MTTSKKSPPPKKMSEKEKIARSIADSKAIQGEFYKAPEIRLDYNPQYRGLGGKYLVGVLANGKVAWHPTGFYSKIEAENFIRKFYPNSTVTSN